MFKKIATFAFFGFAAQTLLATLGTAHPIPDSIQLPKRNLEARCNDDKYDYPCGKYDGYGQCGGYGYPCGGYGYPCGGYGYPCGGYDYPCGGYDYPCSGYDYPC